MKIKVFSLAAVALAIVAFLTVACQAPPAALDEPVQAEVVNAFDFAGAAGATDRGSLLCATEDGPCVESWNGSDIVVYSDAGGSQTFLVDGATGDVTVAGGLSVTGGVTGTNVLTTGNQTVGGVKTFTDTGTFSGAVTVGGGYGSTGCTLSAAGVLQCNGAANIDGALYSVSPVLTKDANYPVTVADSGAIIKNTAVVSATFTLPAAAAGLNYCVFNYAGTDVIIEFTDSADVALNEVNSAGDSVTNTTAYDSICLTAIDAVNWMTVSSVGTWADGN